MKSKTYLRYADEVDMCPLCKEWTGLLSTCCGGGDDDLIEDIAEELGCEFDDVLNEL